MPSGKRLLLIDNDAFVLLAGSGHLQAVIATLGLEPADCRYNAPFPFVFRKKIKPNLRNSAIERIERAIAQIKPLELKSTPGLQQQLLTESAIDIGEAILFGVLAEHPATLLTTNDKRALRALSQSPELAGIRQAVCGRIIAVESIIRHLVENRTVEAVANGFIEVSVADIRLSVIFSDNNIANPSHCREAIESYLKHAIDECGADFFYSLD